MILLILTDPGDPQYFPKFDYPVDEFAFTSTNTQYSLPTKNKRRPTKVLVLWKKAGRVKQLQITKKKNSNPPAEHFKVCNQFTGDVGGVDENINMNGAAIRGRKWCSIALLFYFELVLQNAGRLYKVYDAKPMDLLEFCRCVKCHYPERLMAILLKLGAE
ncbi:chimeric ERCC6-PGBD3 protein [Trichonephila clavipes]|nr:chimeric ERCC6-PGBD3 protein [Trichonephila clavipes]